MKIKITKPGIYGAKEEVAVGTVIDVSKEPVQWRGRYEIIEDNPSEDAELVPASPTQPVDPDPTPTDTKSADSRSDLLFEAATLIEDDDFTKDGYPKIDALNDVLDEDEDEFQATERDQLWPAIAEAVMKARKEKD